ncbi:MAG: hypothetical protein WC642_16095, partial [Nocardioides sp.]
MSNASDELTESLGNSFKDDTNRIVSGLAAMVWDLKKAIDGLNSVGAGQGIVRGVLSGIPGVGAAAQWIEAYGASSRSVQKMQPTAGGGAAEATDSRTFWERQGEIDAEVGLIAGAGGKGAARDAFGGLEIGGYERAEDWAKAQTERRKAIAKHIADHAAKMKDLASQQREAERQAERDAFGFEIGNAPGSSIYAPEIAHEAARALNTPGEQAIRLGPGGGSLGGIDADLADLAEALGAADESAQTWADVSLDGQENITTLNGALGGLSDAVDENADRQKRSATAQERVANAAFGWL